MSVHFFFFIHKTASNKRFQLIQDIAFDHNTIFTEPRTGPIPAALESYQGSIVTDIPFFKELTDWYEPCGKYSLSSIILVAGFLMHGVAVNLARPVSFE